MKCFDSKVSAVIWNERMRDWTDVWSFSLQTPTKKKKCVLLILCNSTHYILISVSFLVWYWFDFQTLRIIFLREIHEENIASVLKLTQNQWLMRFERQQLCNFLNQCCKLIQTTALENALNQCNDLRDCSFATVYIYYIIETVSCIFFSYLVT